VVDALALQGVVRDAAKFFVNQQHQSVNGDLIAN
jgi:hypothetical protein